MDERFGASIQWFATSRALQSALLAHVPPRLQVERLPATGLAHMRRMLPTGELFLIDNASAEAVNSPIRIESTAQRLYEFDPLSGATYALDAKRDGKHLVSRLVIKGRAATILLATNDELDAFPRQPSIQSSAEAISLTPVKISRTEPNVLVIDTCELTMQGKTYPREPVYAANKRFWQAHGFETNGWFSVIQYRDQITGMNQYMHPESGGIVTYRFDVADGVDLDRNPARHRNAAALADRRQRPIRRSFGGRSLARRQYSRGDSRSLAATGRKRRHPHWTPFRYEA